MDFDQIYHFLFETMPGIGCLMGAALIISIIVAFLFERKVRKQFTNHPDEETDEWSLFEDEENEEESK